MNNRAKQMIKTLKYWWCPEHLKNDPSIDVLISNIYNEAINDVIDFIDVMIERNPQQALTLEALKANMLPGMKIDDSTK